MKVTFWGVRGSVPRPLQKMMYYGGNTSCVQVDVGTTLMVLDAGTGIVSLGDMLKANGPLTRPCHILFTHTHWDHIQGFPFFLPLYDSQAVLKIYGVQRVTDRLESVLHAQMENPYFPVGMGDLPAQLEFIDVTDMRFQVGEAKVTAAELVHPGGVLGFRIEAGGKAVVYATDSEHDAPAGDEPVIQLSRGADLLILDATYTPEEYHNGREGFGHGTWLKAVEVARAAEVGELVLFHHDPWHDDDFVAGVEREARAAMANSRAAREGVTIDL